jgi:hypothetical protein
MVVAVSSAPNRLPATPMDNRRCRQFALGDRDLVLSDDYVDAAWLACQNAPVLHDWR